MTETEILARYAAGERVTELAQAADIPRERVYYLARRAGIRRSRPRPPRSELIEDAEFLADTGVTLTEALARLGVRRDNLWQAAKREGRSDVYWALADREPNGLMRRAVSRARRQR